MAKRFYLDTSIWRDYFEDRKDGIKPLGEFAFRFLKECEKRKAVVLVSDTVVLELKVYFSEKQIEQIFSAFKDTIQWIEATPQQVSEARAEWLKIGKSTPFKDALHAVLAKHHKALLITRDSHFFEELSSITEAEKPESVIFD